ncbi:hypothetical protein OOT55_12000 [Marinimicrobium sp. C6131]|uniref:hypothetical protein n=1 Tax=Marinimicrobium sp. C6131 TaxID=3022676 RepID=UPI00223D8279|nr:hypothetical protein [Marinimicrobium sp. C6131]UZJ43374.1 hypothetical protein OOT55_12000 [Marinimicrobium sp. C6131]
MESPEGSELELLDSELTEEELLDSEASDSELIEEEESLLDTELLLELRGSSESLDDPPQAVIANDTATASIVRLPWVIIFMVIPRVLCISVYYQFFVNEVLLVSHSTFTLKKIDSA